jgi:esterase/lipase
MTRLNLPPAASVAGVSPDGKGLLVAHRERDNKMYTRRDLHVIALEKALQAADAAEFLAEMNNISASLDRDVLAHYWTQTGIFGAFVDGTCIRVAHFGENGQVTPIDLGSVFLAGEFHATMTGRIGLVGANAQTFPEAYLAEPPAEGTTWQVNRLSDFGRLVEGWDLGTVETVSWKSKDGVEIEGVLRKPAGFDPARKYPLVFIVHGGPTWFSEAYLLPHDENNYYPGVQFVNKDVLVVKPNYRGSIGRGHEFLELNVNNLGVGDLWDLESGVEHLAELGWVDKDRVGCMGWSQGGYISAFAALHSDKFRAVSVGAGISDWYTYHISNDIPDFTVDYLSGSPFRDRDLYLKTSPIDNIANAKTPMLIQHGWDDRRVPVSNAMELYRGLKEMGVPVELFVYPGMGHPITKPRENHAIMHQNLAWFSHYLLDEELELE